MSERGRPPHRHGGASAGHGTQPHTADLVIEAWAPDAPCCLEHAVLALVESFAAVGGDAPARRVPFRRGPERDDELLLGLLEEVVYLTDVHGVVPVATHVERDPDGGVHGWFDVVDLARVEVVGPAPKAISREGLLFEHHDGQWRGRALVDV